MKSPTFLTAAQHRCRRNFWLVSAVATALIAVRVGAVGPFPVTVGGDGGGPGTLRSQIAAAPAGNTVYFPSGLTFNSIGLTMGELVISKDLTIAGPGATNMLVFNSSGRVFQVNSGANVTISGLTLTGTLVGANGANGVLGAQDGQPGVFVAGGAISNAPTCTLTLGNCVFTNCSATGGNGGDAYTNEFNYNTPGNGGAGGASSGGALANDGDCVIFGCTFVNNYSQGGTGGKGYDGGSGGAGGEGDGGAVEIEYFASVLSVVNSTFNGNTAFGGTGGRGGDGYIVGANPGGVGGKGGDAVGGAVFVTSGCPLADCDGILHCTISGNVSSPAIGGAGGLGANGAPNGANGANGRANAGGLWFSNMHVLPVGNSIIAGNYGSSGFTTWGPDVGGPLPATVANITSNTNNIIGLGDGSSGWIMPNDLVGSIATGFMDPVLGPLQINGGQTATMAPLACSPAIDAGTAQGQAIDQAGQNRTVVVRAIVGGGDGTDIGAYELQAFPMVTLGIAQANGNITLSWPAPDDSCFVLQEMASLAAPFQWTNVTNQVNVVGNQNQVVIPLQMNGNLFFRLWYP